MTENPCNACLASKIVRDTYGCNRDRLHNAFEDLKHELWKKYSCSYQCRFADVVNYEASLRSEVAPTGWLSCPGGCARNYARPWEHCESCGAKGDIRK